MRTNVLEKARERGLKIEGKINNHFDELLKKEKRKVIGKEIKSAARQFQRQRRKTEANAKKEIRDAKEWKSDIAKEEKRRRKEVTDWKAEAQKWKKETQRLRRNAKARERRAEENRRIAEGKWKGKNKFARLQLKVGDKLSKIWEKPREILKPILVKHAIKKVKKYVITPNGNYDPAYFLTITEDEVKTLINSETEPRNVRMSLVCEFTLKDYKVNDHCHYTGKYRGAAHNSCNLRMRQPKFIPVLFHNLEGYDAHLFIKNLGVNSGDIKCIPKTEEKYISFTKEVVVDTFKNKDGKKKKVKREFRFLDSFKFMASSLDKLTKGLGKDDFENLDLMTSHYTTEQREILKKKGVYPYEYMNGFDRLEETSLPPKSKFFSSLTNEDISDTDYKRAQNAWNNFGMKTMRDYHDLYLKTDVLLLADVIENFRKVCRANYGLDPMWYYTAPGLAWDACLKLTEVELDLISDPNMYLLVERGIRGGISTITKRHAIANNKYMTNYDPKKESKYLPYLDANNLYGWAMSQPLPIKDFKWMNDNELEKWTEHSCILEVDLEYPDDLHNLHNE
jgi:hypothetical protein